MTARNKTHLTKNTVLLKKRISVSLLQSMPDQHACIQFPLARYLHLFHRLSDLEFLSVVKYLPPKTIWCLIHVLNALFGLQVPLQINKWVHHKHEARVSIPLLITNLPGVSHLHQLSGRILFSFEVLTRYSRDSPHIFSAPKDWTQ